MSRTDAGGAAAHAGVDFQQRLAAWFATSMLTQVDISPLLSLDDSLYVETISFETADQVDDLVLACRGGRKVFVQAKTSTHLSLDLASDFARALKQFVTQYRLAPEGRDAYVLALGPTASGKLRFQLSKLLQAVRYDPEAWTTLPLNEAEKQVLESFLSLVGCIAEEVDGRAWTGDEVVRFAQRVYIATFDLEDAGSDCRSAYVLLHTLPHLRSPADLVWSRLVQLCLDASRKRLRIGIDGLRGSLARFLGESENVVDAKDLLEIVAGGRVHAEKEVLLLEHADCADSLLLGEFRRFDEHGQRRFKFTQGKCVFSEGEFAVIHRAATVVGMLRYLERNAGVSAGREVLIAPSEFTADAAVGTAAKARAQWIQEALRQLRDLTCLQCGRPVSASVSTVVEIDDEDHFPAAGVVHQVCAQPMHRVLGEGRSPFFRDNPHLIDFDAALWVRQLRNGQGALSGLREAGAPPNAVIAWNPEAIERNLHYCIRVRLTDGSNPAVLRRGKVDRFSLKKGKEGVAELQQNIKMAASRGNPFCMSADGRVFGPRSELMAYFAHEEVVECASAELTQYTPQIGEEFDNKGDYYAPLIVVRVGEGEEPLRIGGACVLLSDVLRVEEHFVNWAGAGIILSDYYLEVIPDDAAFDAFMRRNVASGQVAVIDPMLAPDGSELSGTPVASLPDLQKRGKDRAE